MIQKCAEDTKHGGVAGTTGRPNCPPERPQWRNGLISGTPRGANFFTWEGAFPSTNMLWEPPDWKAALQKKPQRSWWTRRQKFDLAVRGADVSWAPLEVLPVEWGRWSIPSTQHHTIPDHMCPVLSSPEQEGYGYWRHFNERPQRWWRDRSISSMRKYWQSWDCLV